MGRATRATSTPPQPSRTTARPCGTSSSPPSPPPTRSCRSTNRLHPRGTTQPSRTPREPSPLRTTRDPPPRSDPKFHLPSEVKYFDKTAPIVGLPNDGTWSPARAVREPLLGDANKLPTPPSQQVPHPRRAVLSLSPLPVAATAAPLSTDPTSPPQPVRYLTRAHSGWYPGKEG